MQMVAAGIKLTLLVVQAIFTAVALFGIYVAGFILDQNLMGQMAPSYKNQWVILKMYGSL